MESPLGITNLPVEVLLKIFKFCDLRDLLNVRCVCKHWMLVGSDALLYDYSVLSDELSYKQVKIILEQLVVSSACSGSINFKILQRIDATFLSVFLANLLLSSRQNYSKFSFSCISCCCSPEYSYDTVVYPLLTLEKLKQLQSAGFHKNCLEIKYSCGVVASSLLNCFAWNVFTRERTCANVLQKLKFSHIMYLSECCVKHSSLEHKCVEKLYTQQNTSSFWCTCYCNLVKVLVDMCTNLVSFTFKSNFHLFGHSGLDLLCSENMQSIFENLCINNSRLSVLKISARSLFDKDILLLKSLPDLSVLHLYEARKLSFNCIEVFVTIKKLKSFCLADNLIIKPMHWKQFIDNTNIEIESVSFHDCLVDNSVMFSISKNCKNLRKLDLNGCRNDSCELTSEGLIAVFKSCRKLRKVILLFIDKELKNAVNFLPEHVEVFRIYSVN